MMTISLQLMIFYAHISLKLYHNKKCVYFVFIINLTKV